MTSGQRHHLVLAAIRWCSLSVAWAALAGGSSLVAGLVASSLALVGLGANAMLDGTASAVLVWRFRNERSARADPDAVERRAALAVGVLMIAVALYLAASSVSVLASHSVPEESPVGIALAAASVVVLPLLARAKLRLAVSLRSRLSAAMGCSAWLAASSLLRPCSASCWTQPSIGGGPMPLPLCLSQRCSSRRAWAPSGVRSERPKFFPLGIDDWTIGSGEWTVCVATIRLLRAEASRHPVSTRADRYTAAGVQCNGLTT